MISERDISEKFSVIWKQNLPLMTPSFMRVFNETQIKKINKNPIPNIENVRYDIVSETAFNVSEMAIVEDKKVNEIITDSEVFEKIVYETAKSIWTSGNYKKEDLKLGKSEIEEIQKICDNTIEFINKTKKEKIEFKPRLKGYSFIPDLTADLSVDDSLYEIKTVSRNFKSSDLKQLFIYLALRQVSTNTNWKYAGLYNPRKGTYAKFNVKSLISNLTGGQTPNEIFENILNGLVRDIEVDSEF
ncbi:hypothetical protein LB450_08520 [Psychroflexus sp. CAK1W]|uniref:hypothetical protein n=1 Tax=Psychroflexus curvus TaxID=2873595 RepID=UPI001CCA2AED|nr:hypothetical protein [Psychroflexus curvus]MBZ9628140.1 hypothetical protein [Psychroflexus curvus]